MPRLLSCDTCCLLFSQLYDGRCAACANRRAILTKQPLPVPPQPAPDRKGPGRPTVQVRICRCCQQVKQRSEMTIRDKVPPRMRGWCIACREIERERQREEQAERLRRQNIARGKAMGLHNPVGRPCTRCKAFKPWDAFYASSTGVNGKQSRCRACQTSGQPAGAPRKGMADQHGRECSRCRVYKPWNDYYVLRVSTTGYHAACKECIKAVYRDDEGVC